MQERCLPWGKNTTRTPDIAKRLTASLCSRFWWYHWKIFKYRCENA